MGNKGSKCHWEEWTDEWHLVQRSIPEAVCKLVGLRQVDAKGLCELFRHYPNVVATALHCLRKVTLQVHSTHRPSYYNYTKGSEYVEDRTLKNIRWSNHNVAMQCSLGLLSSAIYRPKSSPQYRKLGSPHGKDGEKHPEVFQSALGQNWSTVTSAGFLIIHNQVDMLNHICMWNPEFAHQICAEPDMGQMRSRHRSLLVHACAFHRHTLVEVLIRHLAVDKADEDSFLQAMWEASSRGDSAILEMLLDASATKQYDANQVDVETGRTLLHAAVECGSAKCCKLLLSRTNIKRGTPSFGKTALQLATEEGHVECIKVLESTVQMQ